MSGRYQVIGEDSDDEVTPRPAQRAETGGHIGAPISGGAGPTAVSGVAEMTGTAGGQQFLTVEVPRDWKDGQHLMIPTPTGNQVVSVPPGLAPGQQFRVPVPAAPQQLLNVQVPAGIGPGQQLTVRAPNGQLFMATVPPGHTAGSTFQMAIPRGTGPAVGGAPGGGPPPPRPPVNQAELAASAKDQAVGWKETAGVLEMMLSSLEPGENVSANELIQELVEQCQTASRMSQQILEDCTDEGAMMAVLESNDVVMAALAKYEAVLVGGTAAAPPPPPPAPPAAGNEAQPAWLAGNLGGSGEAFPGAAPEPPPPQASHTPFAPPPQAAKSMAPPVQLAEEDPPDLLNLAPEPAAATKPAAAATPSDDLEAMFGNTAAPPQFSMQQQRGMMGMQQQQQPAMALPTMHQPTMGIGAMGVPMQTNPIAQMPMQAAHMSRGGGGVLPPVQQKPSANPPMGIPASNIMAGPGVTPMGMAPVTSTSNVVKKDTAALDAEANDLLAEFDDLIGSMETTGMGAVPPAAAAGQNKMTDK